MWLLIKANFALLSQFCYEEISTIFSKCDRKMFVSKINNPHCHVWPSLLAACTWRRIRSIQQKWWSESEKCCCSYSCCKNSACMLLWLKVYFTKKDDTAGGGWWWGVSGVAGWHWQGAVGAGMLGASSPALMLHLSGWWSMAYPHHLLCASYETEVSEHGHSAEMNFAVLKRKKLRNIVMSHCYVSVWVWVFESATLIVSKQMSNCFLAV